MPFHLSAYAALAIAIAAEVIATSSLKLSDGFANLVPGAIALAAYAVSFYFLALALRGIPIGIAYGIWSAVGIAAISAIGWFVFKQYLDTAAIIGLGLIIGGVVVIQLFSKTTTLSA